MAVRNETAHTPQSCCLNAVVMISSFDQNPASGGIPERAAAPIRNVQNVTGIGLRSPPISLMLLVSVAWITDPAARNSRALKNACVNRWNSPGVYPATPMDSPATMYASCDTVEYARTRLMSSWTMARTAAINIVIDPITATNVSAPEEAW